MLKGKVISRSSVNRRDGTQEPSMAVIFHDTNVAISSNFQPFLVPVDPGCIMPGFVTLEDYYNHPAGPPPTTFETQNLSTYTPPTGQTYAEAVTNFVPVAQGPAAQGIDRAANALKRMLMGINPKWITRVDKGNKLRGATAKRGV